MMIGKRGQLVCSNDVTMMESMPYDEGFGGINRKRHCKVRSPFNVSSPTRREASIAECNDPDDAVSADALDDVDSATKLRLITSQWSEKIIEGLRNLHNTKDLKGPLSDFLIEFYHAVAPLRIECGDSSADPPAELDDELVNRINQLTHRNNVLCNVVRHQYEIIKRLQASESLNSTLIKEKAALSEELKCLKECINDYVSSMGSGVASSYSPFDSDFTRRPPDVF